MECILTISSYVTELEVVADTNDILLTMAIQPIQLC